MSTGYYLLDNPNPHGPNYYTTRRRALVAIVVHITAGLEDLDGEPDHSAERTARYAATTTRDVSWHSGSDTDSALDLLPASYTAWHVRGYSSSTYGHEISKRDTDWENQPDWWVTKTLTRASHKLARRAVANNIPIRRISRAQLDRARNANDPSQGGFIGHAPLDPTRRTDPGRNFPWDRFLHMTRKEAQLYVPIPPGGLPPRGWADAAWRRWVERSGTNPRSRNWALFREDIGWIYTRVVAPLENRVKSLENRMARLHEQGIIRLGDEDVDA